MIPAKSGLLIFANTVDADNKDPPIKKRNNNVFKNEFIERKVYYVCTLFSFWV